MNLNFEMYKIYPLTTTKHFREKLKATLINDEIHHVHRLADSIVLR